MKQKKLAQRPLLLCLLLCTVMAAGCSRKPEPISKTSFLLNTVVDVTLYDTTDETILEGCLEVCRDYENKFSKTIETSELYQLNHRSSNEQTITVSDDMGKLLEKGLYYSRISEGDFDITVEPLSSLWNFTDGQHLIPPADQIKAAAARIDYENVELDGNQLTFLSAETTMDLGAIAKGYIADRMKEYLLDHGVNSAVINLGGNVLCVGEKPNGSPFKIGLQKPFEGRSETVAALDIKDMSVVSSGVYERHFVVDGVNYHHILNPETGYPYDTGLVSVTIISKESVDGDGLSTTCLSLGLERGLELLNSMEETYGVFITADYNLHYSEGAEQFLVK